PAWCSVFCSPPAPSPISPLFPYTTLFRSHWLAEEEALPALDAQSAQRVGFGLRLDALGDDAAVREGRKVANAGDERLARSVVVEDRKSTRLNSSHQITSYAVFRLKKNTIA